MLFIAEVTAFFCTQENIFKLCFHVIAVCTSKQSSILLGLVYRYTSVSHDAWLKRQHVLNKIPPMLNATLSSFLSTLIKKINELKNIHCLEKGFLLIRSADNFG